MKNNIELFLCVQAEDVEYLLEILDRDWKEANRKLIGIQYYDVREIILQLTWKSAFISQV